MELLEWERLGRSLWLCLSCVGFEEGATDKYNCLCRLFKRRLERREKRIPDIGGREEGKKKGPG